VLGSVTEIAPGQFRFTAPTPVNSSHRFYRVSSPWFAAARIATVTVPQGQEGLKAGDLQAPESSNSHHWRQCSAEAIQL
jgi:hypothetical protein